MASPRKKLEASHSCARTTNGQATRAPDQTVRYSLIIPVHNSEQYLPEALSGLAGLGSHWEILVINDSSRIDPVTQISHLLPRARCCPSRVPGAAGARNSGSELASGGILVFLDSDVLTTPATLEALAADLEVRQDLSAIFGCYAGEAPDSHGPFSRFRNLLHRYVHRRCAGIVESFWTGLGAIRTEAFQAIGGFNERVFKGASIEDVEFGARLSRAGYKVLLDPRYEGIHLKSWPFWQVVKTDIFDRAAPWTLMILEGRVAPDTLNGGWPFRLGPLLFLMLLLAVGLAPAYVNALLAVYCLYNLPLWSTLAREGGWQVALLSVPATALHHLCCCLGATLGTFQAFKSWLHPAR